MSESYILWFDEADAVDLALVGGKGANLAKLVQAGFAVPPGFCVTSRGYRDFVASGGLIDRIAAHAAGAGDAASAAAAERRIAEAMLAEPVPAAIAEPIRAAYARLGESGCAVAVRSSATAEDLPEASFAGQQDTYLNVRGQKELLEHVRRCWASLWTARAISYRLQQGFSHDTVLLAVIVQAMIEADVAGVAFTANPISGRRDETVINASLGLGEAVVSGRVTPDMFVVRPAEGRVCHREIAHKEIEMVCGAGGAVEERSVDADRAARPSLADAEALAVADLGRRVEALYGAPQDVEWAYCQGRLYLLQTRPITTLSAGPDADPRDHWTRAMFVELLPDAPSPLFCSVLEPVLTAMFDFSLRRLGQRPVADIPAVAVFHHQPYVNLRYITASLAGLPEATRERLAGRLADPFSDHAEIRQGRVSVADLRLGLNALRVAQALPGEVSEVVARYHEDLARLAQMEHDTLTDRQIVETMDGIALRLLTPLVQHDLLLIAALGLMERIVRAMVERSKLPDAESLHGQLLSGISGNVTMQANTELWRLSELARSRPAVAEAFADVPTRDLARLLPAVHGGAEFTAALDRFLAGFGHREARLDVAAPTWGEDPTPVLAFVRAYLAGGAVEDPARQEQLLARRRREATEDVRRALGATVAGRLLYVPVFDWCLERCRRLAADRDTMHFHWTASFPLVRRLVRLLGRRWADRGLIDEPDDVYCLPLSELKSLCEASRPVHQEVARRRREWERDGQRQWPLEIRGAEEVYPGTAADPPAGAEMLRGIAGSPGVARGRACVVLGPADFGKLARGDVLVAPLTNPVWTPLFAIAAAIVTDTGGILSHGAIVAREYGIPAVMGATGATRALRDGQQLLVDGAQGTVHVERPSRQP